MALKTEDIRNIALIGHQHSGKTLLAEALLHKAGMINRLGLPDDGTTISDYEDEEKERKTSIESSIVYASWKNRHLNILDTPGYQDFIGQVYVGLSPVETAVLVISATGGIEITARRVFEMAKQRGLALAIVVNKCDGENVDLLGLFAELQESFGTACRMANVPVGQGSGFKIGRASCRERV